jgi:uncharacterized membrane protein
MLLPIHIAAGGLAIVLGAVALLVRKGGTLHRRSGLLFVYAMLVMGISAAILSLRKSPTNVDALGAWMTVYFVGTALTAVRGIAEGRDVPHACFIPSPRDPYHLFLLLKDIRALLASR